MRKIVLHKLIEEKLKIKILNLENKPNDDIRGHHSDVAKLEIFLNNKGSLQSLIHSFSVNSGVVQ